MYKIAKIAKYTGLLVMASILLVSCSKGLNNSTTYSPGQIAEAIITAQYRDSMLQPLLPDDDYFNGYLTNIYKLDTDEIIDGAIYYSVGMLADEIAVLQLADDASADDVKNSLIKYKDSRADAFRGYAPEQTSIIESSAIVKHGVYVALLICEKPQNAESVFLACFSSDPPDIKSTAEPMAPGISPPKDDSVATPGITGGGSSDKKINSPTDNTGNDQSDIIIPAHTGNDQSDIVNPDPPEKPADEPSDNPKQITVPSEKPGSESADVSVITGDDTETTPAPPETSDVTDVQEDNVYAPETILIAWRSGDISGLSDMNRKILLACTQVIDKIIRDDMSEYEKELAINDWIVDHANYDSEANSNAPDAKPDPNNYNPYGLIFSGKAICSGYTSTFQLFMDMLGIECIRVDGVYKISGEVHAWNMVRIDEQWYCVDVTWNDPIGGNKSDKHRYFNVTTEFMRATGHQWDETSTPLADAGKLYVDER